MLACEGPFLLDVAIPDDQNVFDGGPGAAMSDVLGAIDVAVGAVHRRARPAGACARAGESPALRSMRGSAARWESDPEDKGPREGREQPEDADVEGESR